MNLKELFEIQKVLRERIGYNEPDRFNKLVLALLVELGECANEWQGFKFWSKDQEPRTKQTKGAYDFTGAPVITEYNPLLEEYVDGLHFVLELGIEKGFDKVDFPYLHEYNIGVYTETDGTEQFTKTFNAITDFIARDDDLESYEDVFLYFIGLSKHFGFTWEEVEAAYMEKNKVNHARQESGY